MSIMPFNLRTIPISKQNRIRKYSFKKYDQDRIFIGVDTETTRDLGQEPLSLQIAMYKGDNEGNKEFEALYILNEEDEEYRKQYTLKIQGYTVNVVEKKTPARNWKILCNRLLLANPKNTMAFFNILFDVPLIWDVKPSKNRYGFWNYTTKVLGEKKYQTVFLRRIEGMKTIIEQNQFQFLDTQTLSIILFDEHSLQGASNKVLGLNKLQDSKYGKEYAIWDACLTSLLAMKLSEHLQGEMKLDIRPDSVKTAGTFTKYILGNMGFRRPNFQNKDIKPFWEAFYGGKVECNPNYVKKPLQKGIIYADMVAQYANALHLSDSLRFMTCKDIKVEKTDVNDSLLTHDFRNASISAKAKVKDAPLTVRTEKGNIFADADGAGIYMLPDLWAAKLLNPDCEIEIIEAYKPIPSGRQQNLEEKHGLRPYNLIKDLIDKRKHAKDTDEDKLYKNIANTLWGITAEGQRENRDKQGIYTNPVVASTVTAVARYWLAQGESYLDNQDSEVHYMATDSFFIEKEQYKGLKEHMRKQLIDIDIKGKGEALLTISAHKYGLYASKNGKKIAKDREGKWMVSEHGLTSPLLPKGRFDTLLRKNWIKAFECYDKCENPMHFEGFEGLDIPLVHSQTISSTYTYEHMKNMFKQKGLNANVRPGMFFFTCHDQKMHYDDELDNTNILPRSELAFEYAEKYQTRTLELMIRKHFASDDMKYDYKNKCRWKVNLNKDKKKIKRKIVEDS